MKKMFRLHNTAGDILADGVAYPEGNVQVQMRHQPYKHNFAALGEALNLEGVATFEWCEASASPSPSRPQPSMTVLRADPISVNMQYVGKRYLSKKAKALKRDLGTQLLLTVPRETRLPEGDLMLELVYGISRPKDTSNLAKLVEDMIAAHHRIDDIRFRGHIATKHAVARGEEYIAFRISAYDASRFPNV